MHPTLTDKELTNLIAASVAMAIKNKLTLGNWRELMIWLVGYEGLPSVPPNDRGITFDVLAYLTDGIGTMTDTGMRATSVFTAWLAADLIENTLTEKQQVLLMHYLMLK